VLGLERELARVGRPATDPAAADVLIVAGAVTRRQAPLLVETWRRMSAPRWVVALGACACGGGMWDGDATLPGLESVVPVDIFIPGCPPPREAVLEGLRVLGARIRAGRDEALRPPVGRPSAR
jgi:NADH-quinone oxidoreductase subunit B